MSEAPNLTEYVKKKGNTNGSAVQNKDGAPNLHLYVKKQEEKASVANLQPAQTPSAKLGSVGAYVGSQLSAQPLTLAGTPLQKTVSKSDTSVFRNPLAPGAGGSPTSAHVTTPTTRLEMRKRADQSGGAQALTDALSRIGHETASSAQNFASGMLNAGAVLAQLGSGGVTAPAGAMYATAPKGMRDMVRDTGNAVGEAESKVAYGVADDLSRRAEQHAERAREGASTAGRIALDVYGQGLQMAGDLGIGLATGGSSLVPMAVRSFGSGAQEARQNGADVNRAALYGAGNAAVEVLTEKMFDGLAGIYGKGGADEYVESVINKLAKTDRGRSALKILSSMGGEALEEIVSGAIDPALKSIYNGKSIGQNYTKDTVAEIAYSALIGGILGGLGGSVDAARPKGLYAAPNVTQNASPQILGQGAEQTIKAGEITPQTSGANLDAKNAPGGAGKGNSKNATIVEHLQRNIPTFAQMDPVAVISGTELPTQGRASDRALVFLQSIGNKVTRMGFGDVFFSRKNVKNSLVGHGASSAKIETIAAVPAVIQSGVQLDHVQNYEGRGYDTYIFGAPVNYKGRPVMVGVVVAKDQQSGRYYVHEVVDSDGNIILDSKKPGGDSDNPSTGDAVVTPSGSINSISDALPKVNTENVPNPDTSPRMLNGQLIAQAVSNLDTSGPQGTEADRAPRMLNGQALGTQAALTRENIPVKAQQYLSRAENAMLRNVKNALGVDRFADRVDLKDAVQSMSSEYLETGKVSPETRAQLFEQAYEQGRVLDTEMYDQYKSVKDFIRTTPVSISQEATQDIADFKDFRNAAFGTMRISADGTPVDIVYEELRAMAPELFPGSIMAESDQLQRIYEVGKMIRRIENDLDNTYGDQSEDFKRWAKNDFDAAIDASIAELNRVRRYARERAEGKTAPEITEQNVAHAFSQIRDARHTMERAKAKNLLTDYDDGQVGRLLRGEITLDDLDPNKVNIKGVREVYEASRDYDRYAETIREYNKQRKASLLAEADGLLETANSWKDKKAGILYSRETMERNVRDIIPDRAIADAINDKYFTPVHEAEAEGNRFKNKYRDRVRSLELSRDVADGNVVSEAHAVQLLGEASDNLRMLNEKGKAGEKRDGKTAQEWEAAIRELWEQNPNLDRNKIENAVKAFRVIYDELFQQMNEVRVRNGYEPVGYRQGYFPHFQADTPTDILGLLHMKESKTDEVMALFGKALGIDLDVGRLPTNINGMTHTFKPGITWFGSAQERTGFDTVYDAVEGFDKYIEGVSNVIHQTDNIQRLRALATQIRYRTTDEGMREQMDAIRSNQNLDEDEQRTKLDELYNKGRFTLGNFVVELEEYTNLLANKKSRADRNMEQALGRRMFTAMKNLESRVAANMVAVNPGSWLTNFIPLTQGWATLDTKSLLQGMRDTLAAYKSDDGMVARSTFLTNRRGSDPLVKTWAQKASATLSTPMEYIDQFTADTLVRARYAQNVKSGLSEENAIREADAWAAGIMADRSKGSMPTIFNRSNPFTKLFTQFQLEVNNEFSNIFKDVPDELKKKGAAALTAGLLKYFVGAWLYNEVYEYIVGRRAAFDPIDIANDAVGDLTGYHLPNTIEGLTNLAKGEPYGFETQKAGNYGTIENLAKNAAEELPFIGGVLGGGRVPISSALPDWGNLAKAAVNDQWNDRKRVTTAIKELGKPATYLALPFGGGQLRKIYQGIKAVKEGGSYSVDSQGRDILQYPVFNDTPGEVASGTARALLFGKSSLPMAREWVDSGFDSLGAKQTAVYQGMNAVGVSDRDAYALLRQMEGVRKTDEESANTIKRHILQTSDISGEGKSIVYYGLMASDKEQAIMDDMPDGTDMGTVTETLMRFKDANLLRGTDAAKAKRDAILDAELPELEKRILYRGLISEENEEVLNELINDGLGVDDWLRLERDTAGITSDKDAAGKAIKGKSRQDRVRDIIDGYDLTPEQKDALWLAEGYKEDKLGDMPWHAEEVIKYQFPQLSGLSEQQTKSLSADWLSLRSNAGEERVSMLQKSHVIVNSDISVKEQMSALSSLLSESEYRKVETGMSLGVTPRTYITLLETLPQYDDGNGSYTQAEVKTAIDAMNKPRPLSNGKLTVPGDTELSTEQKAALWQMANKGWKPTKNPYSVSVGQRVYDAMHASTVPQISSMASSAPPLGLYAAPDVRAP